MSFFIYFARRITKGEQPDGTAATEKMMETLGWRDELGEIAEKFVDYLKCKDVLNVTPDKIYGVMNANRYYLRNRGVRGYDLVMVLAAAYNVITADADYLPAAC